jgi:hypothetical protein
MSGFDGIAAVGTSIERMLALAFKDREPVPTKQTRALLVKTEDLSPQLSPTKIGPYALSILLYRVDFNKAMRAAWSSVGTADGRGHLALDLHFLVTAWADNAEHEHLILGRAMQAIEFSPVLTGPLYYQTTLPSPAYDDEPRARPTEAIQLLLEEISTEALMRTFDSLPCDYKLTVPYVARVARIDTREARIAPPVVDARIDLALPK